MNNGRKGMVRPGQEATKKYRAICDEYAWRLMEVARNGKLDVSWVEGSMLRGWAAETAAGKLSALF